MTDEEYSSTQSQLMLLARIALGINIDGFIKRINTAETIAPILDPTLYLQGADNLRKIKALAVGASKFQAAIKEVLR